MIVGAAIVPSAPLLVPGVSGVLPAGIEQVCDAVDAALESLPSCDTVVLIAAAKPDEGGSGQGLYDVGVATLAGIGRPDIAHDAPIDRAAVERISRVSQYPVYRGDILPLGLGVLALLVGGRGPFVPMAVPCRANFDTLSATGAALARAFASGDERDEEGSGAGSEEPRAVLIAAGDLSCGLDERSPLYAVEGAKEWDARVLDVVDSGRLEALDRLGPGEATRVGSLGWAPMAVLHGAAARAKLGLARRHYSAPRGVGYLVAQGA